MAKYNISQRVKKIKTGTCSVKRTASSGSVVSPNQLILRIKTTAKDEKTKNTKKDKTKTKR